MNRKTAALLLALVATLTLSGCSASGDSNTAAPSQNQGTGRRNPGNMDPQLQQLMQDQRKTQQQIEQLLQQIHTDAGLPAPANNDQQQSASGQPGPGNGGPRGGGQGPRNGGNGGNGGQGGQGTANGQDLQAMKDALNQEQQAGSDLSAKLTTFDDLVKEAAGNQKALKDAQTLFAPIEESLQVGRGPSGFQGNRAPSGSTNDQSGNAAGQDGTNGGGNGGNGNNGGGRNMAFGVGNRTDLYKSAESKLDAAITQLKTDLGQ